MAVCVVKRLIGVNGDQYGAQWRRAASWENKRRIDKRRIAGWEESKVDSNSERGEELEGLEGS